MSVLNRLNSALICLKAGDQKPLDDFLRIEAGEDFVIEELPSVVHRITEVFADVDVTVRGDFLYFLGRVAPETACSLAKRDIDCAYEGVRIYTGYLHQVLISIDNLEHFIDSLSVMETDKALRLAHGLIQRSTK